MRLEQQPGGLQCEEISPGVDWTCIFTDFISHVHMYIHMRLSKNLGFGNTGVVECSPAVSTAALPKDDLIAA